MLWILQYDDTIGGSRISKEIIITLYNDKLKHCVSQYDKLNFNYYDFSEIYTDKFNYREQVGPVITEIFKIDIKFSLFDFENEFNKDDYNIFF